MKKAWCVLAAGLLSLSLAWAGEAAKATLKVEGMTCGGCVAAVKVQLKRTEGVTAYEVSLEKGEAEVSYDPAKATPEKVAESVSKTGFKASVKEPAGGKEAGGAMDGAAVSAPPGMKGEDSCTRDCCKKGTKPAAAVEQDATATGLVSLAGNATPLSAAFNAAKDRARFLAILSPTCSACVHGAEAIKVAILPTGAAIEVFVVWTPMLGGDGAKAATSSSAIVTAPQVRQYWDPERRVGAAFRKDVFPDAVARMKASVPKDHFIAEHLDQRDGSQPEWDIYLLFEPGIEWNGRAPLPSRWVRQVVLFDEESALSQRRSLLWRNDYAKVPVEGSLVAELRALVSSVRAAHAAVVR